MELREALEVEVVGKLQPIGFAYLKAYAHIGIEKPSAYPAGIVAYEGLRSIEVMSVAGSQHTLSDLMFVVTIRVSGGSGFGSARLGDVGGYHFCQEVFERLAGFKPLTLPDCDVILPCERVDESPYEYDGQLAGWQIGWRLQISERAVSPS